MTKLQTIITAAVLAFAGAAETAAQESFTITGSFSQLPDSMRVWCSPTLRDRNQRRLPRQCSPAASSHLRAA